MLPVRDHLPTRLVPVVNYTLIALNVGVFLFEAMLTAGGGDAAALDRQWALVPALLLDDPIGNAPSLLTHMFLHGGVAHVAGNMLFLWIFGDNVEDALGHVRYALFYFACGLVAAFAQVAAGPDSMVPMLGASGAISGVLAGYCLLYPRSPITVVNPVFLLWFFWGIFMTLPAWVVILLFFGTNLWSALQPSSAAGGVAFMAHVGGFLAGLVLLPLMRARPPVNHRDWDRFVEQRRRLN